MKQLAGGALRGALRIVPLWLIQRAAGARLICPCYHAVGGDPPPHLRHLYRYRTADLFAGDLDVLLRRCHPVGLDEVRAAAVDGVPLPPRAALVTFDDGLREAGEVAAPLLLAKGVPAVFFVNPHFVGNRDMMWRFKASLILDHLGRREIGGAARAEAEAILGGAGFRARTLEQVVLAVPWAGRELLDRVAAVVGVDLAGYLDQARPYLDLDELRSLERQGFAIGGHGLDHAPFPELSDDEQLLQAAASVAWVEDAFAAGHGAFAFPFSDGGVAATLYERAAGEGVELFFGTDYLKSDPVRRSFQRFPMEDDRRSGRDLIAWQLAKKAGRRLLGRDRVVRPSGAGAGR